MGDQAGEPIAPTLDPSVTYAFSDPEEFARACEAKVGAGYVYARWGNPTVDAFKAAVADLEGAADSEAFASGMGAISCTLLALCRGGDKVVATRQLYGNTYSLLHDRLPRYGIETTFCDLHDYAGLEEALNGATLLYCETIGNPRIQVADLRRLGRLARSAGVPLLVDNTFATPVLCRPLEHGASLVLHSATKAIGGHHDMLGGVVCGDESIVSEVRIAARDFGPTMSPFNAWLGLRGITTLPLRARRQSETAAAIAATLDDHPEIEVVYHPSLPNDPSHSLAQALLQGWGGGTIGFELSGGRERAVRFQRALEIIKPAASLGGVHSLIVHAASVTHTQLTGDELAAAGISEGFCRLSIGLEDAGDLATDLGGALKA